MAIHILEMDEQLAATEKQPDGLVKVNEAAPLLVEKGRGAADAAKYVTG